VYGHTDGTDLVYGLKDRRKEIDTFDYNGYKHLIEKSVAPKRIATEKVVLCD